MSGAKTQQFSLPERKDSESLTIAACQLAVYSAADSLCSAPHPLKLIETATATATATATVWWSGNALRCHDDAHANSRR
eukprot:2406564-Pleurochrysis_carterae.AAC.2